MLASYMASAISCMECAFGKSDLFAKNSNGSYLFAISKVEQVALKSVDSLHYLPWCSRSSTSSR